MAASRRIVPRKCVGTGETLTQQDISVVEQDLHDLAVRVRRTGRQRDRWRRKERSFRSGYRHRDHRRIVPRIKPGQYLEIKAEVIADRRILMHLHGDDVQALHQPCRRDRGRVKDRAIIARRRARGQIRDGSIRHVVTRHIHAVDIQHRAVVPLHAEDEVRVIRCAGDVEGASKIRRDVLRLRIPAEPHRGRLIPFAIAELRRPAGPRAVVEFTGGPVRALIRAVIQIFPNGTDRDQRQRNREHHRGRRVGIAAVVARDRRQPMNASHHRDPGDVERRRAVLGELQIIHEKIDVRHHAHRDGCDRRN